MFKIDWILADSGYARREYHSALINVSPSLVSLFSGLCRLSAEPPFMKKRFIYFITMSQLCGAKFHKNFLQ